ncbi:MAG: hypothetical protein ABW205_05190 [Burkholderiales bacterium]
MNKTIVPILSLVLVLCGGNGHIARPDGANDKATPCLGEGVSFS